MPSFDRSKVIMTLSVDEDGVPTIGGGDASAAKQDLQITQETLINTNLDLANASLDTLVTTSATAAAQADQLEQETLVNTNLDLVKTKLDTIITNTDRTADNLDTMLADTAAAPVTTDISDIVLTPLTLSSYAGGAMTAGAVIAATEVLANVTRGNDFTAVADSLVLIDAADQKAALTVFFLSANVAVGTENSAPSLADADALEVLGWVDVATTDYYDAGGVAMVVKKVSDLGFVVKPATGTNDIYVAIVNGAGTPTYAAGSLSIRFGTVR